MTSTTESASLIEYPCHFPIKVMGSNQADFLPTMLKIASDLDPSFDPSTVEQRPSKNGNYLGLTLTLFVHSREQLDNAYRQLSGHPLVKVAL